MSKCHFSLLMTFYIFIANVKYWKLSIFFFQFCSPVTDIWLPVTYVFYFREKHYGAKFFCEFLRCFQPIVQSHCQVKLGSTGSMSVKKSILDGRLLPGKSVLIRGLICDQRLQWNDMPLVRKWTHSTLEIGWKYVRCLTYSFARLPGHRR